MHSENNDWFVRYQLKVTTFWDKVDIADERKLSYLINLFHTAIQENDEDTAELLIDVVFRLDNQSIKVAALNEFLLHDGHFSHQMITKELQDIGHPSSVAIIAKILEQDFKRFEYDASDDGVIAKWFSHALADIGTDEAFELLRKYAKSENKEVANEMRYRLRRITERNNSRNQTSNKNKTNIFKKFLSFIQKL
ncbi:hypothetical protein F959_01720 [Acinetobacter venetianus RAG-1 = CIP 110063]|uniref:HEAT repeat domain-containing protein n=1 Tax=Acinetobacter venetianus (strain ATCC 31012 / DSM 23050 / BCRC 14357 / CCUG 45561 / CIP 110063 / KCTC 2702 / LMG 19082 / RAG-1) TaxID=1191460 RepID=N8YJD6_ACIVR|nr:hypothetical protein [Acinetobacter venetianus]ENV36912.1 hypothetical protein F959_01720 [Acinetobacter venetianus RAG-1 = CIP 110063]